jgi:hypothetical protein
VYSGVQVSAGRRPSVYMRLAGEWLMSVATVTMSRLDIRGFGFGVSRAVGIAWPRLQDATG